MVETDSGGRNIWGNLGCKSWHGGMCGDCCGLLQIESIGKAANIPCEHLGEFGCNIHSRKPKACKIFYCGNLPLKGQLELLFRIYMNLDLPGWVYDKTYQEILEKFGKQN